MNDRELKDLQHKLAALRERMEDNKPLYAELEKLISEIAVKVALGKAIREKVLK